MMTFPRGPKGVHVIVVFSPCVKGDCAEVGWPNIIFPLNSRGSDIASTDESDVSKTLIRNAALSPETIVREEMAHQFADLMETAYFTGDGVNKPLGIFTASANGISTGQDVSTGNLCSPADSIMT